VPLGGWWGVILVIGNEVTSGWESIVGNRESLVGKATKDLTRCKSAPLRLCVHFLGRVTNSNDPPQLSIDPRLPNKKGT